MLFNMAFLNLKQKMEETKVIMYESYKHAPQYWGSS